MIIIFIFKLYFNDMNFNRMHTCPWIFSKIARSKSKRKYTCVINEKVIFVGRKLFEKRNLTLTFLKILLPIFLAITDFFGVWFYRYFWSKQLKKFVFFIFFFFNFFLNFHWNFMQLKKAKSNLVLMYLILFSKIIFTNQKEWRQNYIKQKNE